MCGLDEDCANYLPAAACLFRYIRITHDPTDALTTQVLLSYALIMDLHPLRRRARSAIGRSGARSNADPRGAGCPSLIETKRYVGSERGLGDRLFFQIAQFVIGVWRDFERGHVSP